MGVAICFTRRKWRLRLPVTTFAYTKAGRRGNSRLRFGLVRRTLPNPTDQTRYRSGIDTGARMRLLSFAYRFFTNFAFLAAVYVSLNYIEKYNQRAILAILVLIYAGMRSASA